MNDEIKNLLLKNLNEALTVTKDSIAKAVEFLQQEIPDVIAQLLRWEFAWSLIWWTVGVGMIIGMVVITKKVWKFSKKSSLDDQAAMWGIFSVFGSAAWLFSLMTFFSNFTWLKIWLAPKVYLIEYASRLIQGVK